MIRPNNQSTNNLSAIMKIDTIKIDNRKPTNKKASKARNKV